MAQIERRTGDAGEPFQHLQIGKHLRTRIEVERRDGTRGGDFKRATAIEDRRFGHVARKRTIDRSEIAVEIVAVDHAAKLRSSAAASAEFCGMIDGYDLHRDLA